MTAEKMMEDDFEGLGWREYMRGIETGNIVPTYEHLRSFCKLAREEIESLRASAVEAGAREASERPMFECPDCAADLAVETHKTGCPRSDDSAKRARVAYEAFRGGLSPDLNLVPRWEDAPTWIRDIALVAYLQGRLDAPRTLQSEPVQPAGKGEQKPVAWQFVDPLNGNLGPVTTRKEVADDWTKNCAGVLPLYYAPARPEAPAGAWEALELAEDVLSRSPFSTDIWPNGMHPMTGIRKIRDAILALSSPRGQP